MGRTQQTPRTGKRKASKQKKKDAAKKGDPPSSGEADGSKGAEGQSKTELSLAEPERVEESGERAESSEETGERAEGREDGGRKRKVKAGERSSLTPEEEGEEANEGSSPKKSKIEAATEAQGSGAMTDEPREGGDDSDEAPEDVTLAESKKEAIDRLKGESEGVQRSE